MSAKQEEKNVDGTQVNTESISPPSPAERSRLTKCFTTGSDNLRKGNYDYAVELFGSCVAGDPASAIYLQGFLEALSKKFNGKKTAWKTTQYRYYLFIFFFFFLIVINNFF